jgi:SOS response regulatory protein OraA/RecX
MQAGRNKAAQLKTTEEQAFKQKMYGFLSRRGFGYETISEVVGALWAEQRKAGGDRRHG